MRGPMSHSRGSECARPGEPPTGLARPNTTPPGSALPPRVTRGPPAEGVVPPLPDPFQNSLFGSGSGAA